MNTEIEVKGFYIRYHGDPSVGIYDSNWKLDGGFIFEDKENLEEFRTQLKGAFELCSDGPITVETFEEWEENEKLYFNEECEFDYGMEEEEKLANKQAVDDYMKDQQENSENEDDYIKKDDV